MRDPSWRTLEALGVPLGPPRPPPKAFDATLARRAFEAVAASTASPTEREALAAWLAAIAHHWPSRFLEVAGPEGHRRLRALRVGLDDGRVVKLRRIAIANLAGVL
ncbi:MAG: hypothetical protein AAF928_07770 [Myxococcota bacterium]